MSAETLPPAEKVGWAKVRVFGYVERHMVWRSGNTYFLSSTQRSPLLRRLSPPEDYPLRRSPGLIEFEEIR